MANVTVLSGGGVKGAFQAGVLHQLFNRQMHFSAYCGVSTGALTAAMLAQGSTHEEQADQLGRLLHIYSQIKGNGDIFDGPTKGIGQILQLLGGQSIFRPFGLEALITKHINPDALANSSTIFRCGVVSLETGNYHIITNNTVDVLSYILASASIPGYFPPVNIWHEHFVDGGLRNITPLRDGISVAQDGDTIVLILASPLKTRRYEGQMRGTKILSRTLDIVTNEVYVNDLETLLIRNQDADYKFCPVQLYQPTKHYGSALDFSTRNIRQMLADGYEAKPTILTHPRDLYRLLYED